MVFRLYNQLSDVLQSSQFQLLLVLLTRLRPLIDRELARRGNHQLLLSSTVSEFLAHSIGVDRSVIDRSWEILRPHRVSFGQDIDYQKLADDIFRILGPQYDLAAEAFYPPVTRCGRERCYSRGPLGEPITVQCTLYTSHRGAVPVTSTSLYCRGCLTRYYPNYFVHSARGLHPKRTYYPGVPDFIHVRQHVFVERSLCSFFEMEMAISQVSASNIALVYNYATAPAASPVRPPLHPDHLLNSKIVLDCFFLHALLRDKALEDGGRLVLPHDGVQEHRFDAALRERNNKIRLRGQEMWAHACDDCCKRVQRPDGTIAYMSAGVTDGVTVGHPCCAVLNCQEPLSQGRDRYCHAHAGHLDVCAVEGCSGTTTRGFVTCDDSRHRAWEAKRRRRQKSTSGAAYSILSDRMRRAEEPMLDPSSLSAGTVSLSSRHCSSARPINISVSLTHIISAASSSQGPAPQAAASSSSGIPHTSQSSCPPHKSRRKKPDESSPRVETFKGNIYRRWTHNEQLYVCCCGIIKSRATFFGSEGILGVIVFLKATFPPEYPGSLPCYIFYDNNCNLLRSLRSRQDHYFDNVGLPVDVFHAVHKHNADDRYCQRHCNPMGFPDLRSADNEWLFNSSVAEQVNRWFGGFQRLVREMAPARYHFYLDEAIAIRNRLHSERLFKAGKHPHIVPSEVLRAPVERCSF